MITRDDINLERDAQLIEASANLIVSKLAETVDNTELWGLVMNLATEKAKELSKEVVKQ